MLAEHSNLVLIGFLGVFLGLLRFLNTDVTHVERLFIALFIMAIGYYVYNKFKTSNKTQALVSEQVTGILDYIDGKKDSSVLKFFMTNDKDLFNGLSTLTRLLDSQDKETLDSLLNALIKMYVVYAKLLKDQSKDIERDIVSLIDLRLDVLRILNQIYVKYPQIDHFEVERAVLMIQSTTYKCINVVKHKFHDLDHLQMLPPYASNTHFV